MTEAGATLASIHAWNRSIWDRLPGFERLPAALLLAGPSGVGKRAFADALAQALLCAASRADRTACGQCASCRLLLLESHPDLRVLEVSSADDAEAPAEESGARKEKAASQWIKIDAVRGLRDFLAFTSHLAGRKVVVIHDADRLYANAANALLKTLEEPPTNTHIILVSSHPNRLPVTVRSRCVRVAFAIPGTDSSLEWLAAQGSSHAEAALAYAGGAPLLANEWADGETWGQRRKLVDTVFAAPDVDAVAVADGIDAEQLADLLRGLQRWCYDLTLVAATGKVRYHPDCARILHSIAGRASPVALLAFQRDLAKAVRTLEHPLNPRLVAERHLIGYRTAVKET